MGTAFAAIFVFLFVILFHEFGHFIVAKSVGIKVNEFSIGMGPKIFQKQKEETKYTIRALPIGGYVAMEGEDEASDDPRGFSKVHPFKRILVVAAGAIMNFVLAILVFSIVNYNVGVPVNRVGGTIEGSPAAEAGIEDMATILEIDKKKVSSWDDVTQAISKKTIGSDIEITTEKDGQKKNYSLKTEKAEDGRAVIGISPFMDKISVGQSISSGFKDTRNMIKSMFAIFPMIFRGELGRNSFAGPIGVISTIGQVAKMGFLNVLYMMGFISVNLGFFNLLPIPALDGSRIVFLLIELVRGKPIDPEVEGKIHFIGFILLMALMLMVTYSDISKFNLFKR